MNNSRKIVLVIAGLALIGFLSILGSVFLLKPATLGTGLQVGQLAPEIKGEIQDATRVSLSDFRNKVVCLDFWADW